MSPATRLLASLSKATVATCSINGQDMTSLVVLSNVRCSPPARAWSKEINEARVTVDPAGVSDQAERLAASTGDQPALRNRSTRVRPTPGPLPSHGRRAGGGDAIQHGASARRSHHADRSECGALTVEVIRGERH